MGSKIELNFDDFSDERCYQHQDVGSSLVSQNSGLKERKIQDHSEGTLATPSSPPFSLRSQRSKVLECQKANPMTNDQILDFIEKEVALLKRRKDDMARQRLSPVHNEQCTVAPSSLTEMSPTSTEKCDVAASDDQHVLLEATASCTTNESPVTITEREDISLKPVEGVDLDRVHGSIDANTNAQKSIEDQQSCHVESQEAAETSCLDSLTDKIEINNLRPVTMNHREQSVCCQASSKSLQEDATGVCFQADFSISLPVNKDSKITPPSRPEGEDAFFVEVLNDPQLEDISDAEDLPRLDTNLLNTEQEEEEERFAKPLYEDISEDENPQFQNMAGDVPEASAVQCGPVHNQAKINPTLNEDLSPKEQMSSKTETTDVAQLCSCPCFVECEGEFERVLCPKCDSEKLLKWQLSDSFRPLSVTPHQEETEETADDDSEWLVIPINVRDVNWEPAGEGQADGENILQCDGEHKNQGQQSDTNAAVCEVAQTVPSQVIAAAFPPMEIFDTPSQQAEAIQSREATLQSPLVLSSWTIPETNTHTPQNTESHCDPEDSCETEDSSDYSSDSEPNYLTVSTQLLKNLSVPASPQTIDSDSEKENEDHEMPNLQQCQTRDVSRSSEKDDVINLDSDSEDEGVQNCAETKTKRLFSMHTVNSGAACLNHLKKPSPETADAQCGSVKENLQTRRLSMECTDSPQCQSRCYKDVIQTRNAQLSQRTDKCGHLIENKTGSHHNKKESYAQMISDDPGIIEIFDSEDEGPRKEILGPESMRRGGTSCGEERMACEKKESAKPNNRESSFLSADSSKSQQQSQLQQMQLAGKRPDEHLSRYRKKKKLIKVRMHPEHVHQPSKPKRQVTSTTVETDTANLVKTSTNVVPPELEVSNDVLVGAQSSLCASKGTQITDSSKKLPQAVDRDVDSTKAPREHFQQNTKRKMASKTVKREAEKDLKQKRKTRVLSSETEDSNDALIYAQSSQFWDRVVDSNKVCPELVKQKTRQHMTSEKTGRELEKDLKQKRKTRVLASEMEDSVDTGPSAAFPEKPPNPLDNEDSTVAPNPVIPRLLVLKSSQSSKDLKLLEQSRSFQRKGRNESRGTPETSAETSKKTDSSKTERPLLLKGIKGKIVPKPTSEAHGSCSSSLQRAHSSTLNQSCTPTKRPSPSTSMQSSAKEQIFSDWQKSFVPTRRDRRTSLRNSCDSVKEARHGPSDRNKAARRRRSSFESLRALRKRCKYEAVPTTKDRKQDAREQGFSVSKDYTCKNQADVLANKRKRRRSPPRPQH